MDLYKNFTGHRYWCIPSKYTVIFPQWPEFIVDFNVFVIAAYPELYENYVFSCIPELPHYVDSKVTARGPEIFFLIFLIFSAFLQQKIPIICTQIDNNYMFDMPGCQPPAPPPEIPKLKWPHYVHVYVQPVDLDCYVQPANFALKWPSGPPN